MSFILTSVRLLSRRYGNARRAGAAPPAISGACGVLDHHSQRELINNAGSARVQAHSGRNAGTGRLLPRRRSGLVLLEHMGLASEAPFSRKLLKEDK